MGELDLDEGALTLSAQILARTRFHVYPFGSGRLRTPCEDFHGALSTHRRSAQHTNRNWHTRSVELATPVSRPWRPHTHTHVRRRTYHYVQEKSRRSELYTSCTGGGVRQMCTATLATSLRLLGTPGFRCLVSGIA